MMLKQQLLFSLVLTLAVAGLSNAQMSVTGSIEHQDYHTTGSMTQVEAEIGSVHRKVFHYPGAAALRVVFGSWNLGANDWIEVYSPATGERHKLNNAELAKWQGTSGFFNDDTLWIDLYLAPGSVGSFDVVSYFVGLGGIISGETGSGYQTICGTDNRISSTDNRSARFVANGSVTGGGCTIWLASSDGCAVSAGHCFSGGSLMLAEFNCPPSLSSGALQHPPIADQFPIDNSTVTFTNGGVGNDWGVCKLFTNNLGQTAVSLYGHHNVVATVPTLGDTIRITGFGVDDGVDNQTNQTNTGPLVDNSGSTLGYQVDTTGGNSGSPVIHVSSGDAVGVHTHGGCTSSSTGSNKGTSLSLAAFQSAFTALCNQTPTAPVATFNASSTTIVTGQSVTFTDTSSGVPSSWDWDLDGDGLTDATTAVATFQYNTPGVYNVSLTVTNSLGSDTITMPGLVTVNAITPASVPYSQDFTGGLPAGGEWIFQSFGSTGRIIAGSNGTASPISGSPSLIMDSSVNGTYATNEAILFADLASSGGATLAYWFRETADEADPEDGVFLSNGITEVKIQDHGNGPSTWTEFTIDLTSAATTAGMALTSNMQIIFRQRDNYNIGTDGHLIDDIRLLMPTSVDTGQRNRPDSSMIATGMLDKDGFVPSASQNGPFFLTLPASGVLDLEFQGPANGFMALLAGPLNRNNASFGLNGQLDIGLLGFNNYADIQVVLDGANPMSFIDLFGILTASGQQAMTAQLPAFLPPGPLFTLQTLTYPNLQLTAAIQVIQP